MPLGGEEQILSARQRDLDRLSARERGHCRRCLEERIALFAEAAAERRHDDANILLGLVQNLRQHTADLERRLRTGIDGRFSVLHHADGGDRLHAGVLLRLDLLGNVYLYDVRPLLCLLHIAALAAGVHDKAVFTVAVHHRVDAGQLLIVDPDQLRSRSRVLHSIRYDKRQMVAEEVHLVRAEHRLLRRPRAHFVHAGHICGGDDAHHTLRPPGGGVIHRVDLRVRHRRPDERTVQQSIRADVLLGVVVTEFEPAAGLVHAVHIPDRLADCGTGDFGHDLIFTNHNNRAFVCAEAVDIRRFAAQACCRQLDRLDDLDIAGAAAVVVLQPVIDGRLVRCCIVQQQRLCRHDHARRAEAALHRADIEERALNDRQHGIIRRIFDGLYRFSVHPAQHRHTRARQLAVHKDAARAAVTRAAGLLRALHAPDVSEELEQRAAFAVLHLDRCAVERKSNHWISPSRCYLIFALIRMNRLWPESSAS